MVNLFGRKKKKEAKEVPVHRVWSLDHVVSRSKPKTTPPKSKPRPAKKKPRKKRIYISIASRKPKPRKPRGKVLTRRDDLEALLKMEEELAKKEGKKAIRAGREKPKKKEHGILYFLKPKFHRPKKAKKPKPVPVIKPVAKRGQITTQIDDMVKMVTEKKKVRIDYLAKKLKVPEAKVMEWAEILESDRMITIHYPAFGKPELRVKLKQSKAAG